MADATEKKRGALLTIWLILMLIGSVGGALTYLLFSSVMTAAYPNAPVWMFYIYGIVSLAEVVITIFLFMWKKWAFFAYCVIAVIAFIMNIMIGLGGVTVVIGLLGPVVLYLILRSKWKLLE